jgi:RNA polymerase sigma factor (sigma-70 family)
VSLPPFQSLLDAYGHDVHRFLTASVGPVEADDCYQETWLAALRAYPRLRDAANLRGWLLTVAHRKAIDHHRGRARRPVAIGAATDMASTRSGVAAAPSLPEERGGLWAQVAALPTKQRTALALRFVADLPYEDIAAVMQTSDEAARRNVHEALKRLRREYEQP